MAKASAKAKPRAKAREPVKRMIRCYICGLEQEVSSRALSTSCPGCHKAIRIEDLNINTYVPVNDLQTCGRITVTKKGRIAAKRIQSGGDVSCEGIIHGTLESLGDVHFGAKAQWKGDVLQSRSLSVTDGAMLHGRVQVPWIPPGP